MSAAAVHHLELDLDVFAGPFDLLLSLILREELDLLEVELADVVLAYLDHLEARDELDLEATTEFLVLIAALLELKSRLMLPGEEVEELDELGARRGGRGAAGADAALRALPWRGGLAARARRARRGVLDRSAPLPDELRRLWSSRPRPPMTRGARLRARRRAAQAATGRPQPDGEPARHALRALTLLRELLRRGSFDFDEAVRDADRMTVAAHLFGAAGARQARRGGRDEAEPFAPITGDGRVTPPARIVEALLFLSPDPVSLEDLREATEQDELAVLDALTELCDGRNGRGVTLKEIGGAGHLPRTRGRRRLRAGCFRSGAPRR